MALWHRSFAREKFLFYRVSSHLQFYAECNIESNDWNDHKEWTLILPQLPSLPKPPLFEQTSTTFLIFARNKPTFTVDHIQIGCQLNADGKRVHKSLLNRYINLNKNGQSFDPVLKLLQLAATNVHLFYFHWKRKQIEIDWLKECANFHERKRSLLLKNENA